MGVSRREREYKSCVSTWCFEMGFEVTPTVKRNFFREAENLLKDLVLGIKSAHVFCLREWQGSE